MNEPVRVTPVGPLSASMAIPGSKSLTNRALVCAALGSGTSVLVNASDSEDSALMMNALNLLGVLARETGRGVEVQGTGGRLSSPKFPIPVGNAGTTFRFLLSLAALAPGRVMFEAAPRMAERPLEDLVGALSALGVQVDCREGLPSYAVHGGTFRGGTAHIRGEKSSQFLSSLLLAAPYATGDVQIEVDGMLASAPYASMTVAVMKHFGVTVNVDGRHYRIPSGQRYRASTFEVEADASGASYAFGAAAIAGGTVLARRVRRDSLQGDIGFLGVLERMGCVCASGPDGMRVGRDGSLRGIEADMNAMPDVVPALAAVALFAEGPTTIRGVAHLRHKESDRLEVLAGELRKFGAQISVREDGLEIVPAPLHGAVVDPHSDHRMAMACALVGLRIPGVSIEDPSCVRKSFPKFWSELEAMRGVVS